MPPLDFWHPVLASRDLARGRPVPVRVAGQSLALFRAGPGQVGALQDVCPHRRMKLSLGHVRDGRLTCTYHGWNFDCTGAGESPVTPKMHACIPSFDCREAHGAVWVKARGADRPLPVIDQAGFVPVGFTVHRMRAPLQLVIDNFGEVEHTVSMHPVFGIDPGRGDEAVIRVETDDRSVTVHNTGPAKRPPFTVRFLLQFRRRFLFHSDFTLTFDPPLSVVDHHWTDPVTGREGMVRYRLHHFFVPEDENVSRVVTFGAVRSRWPVPDGCVRLFSWFMRDAMRKTMDEDVWLLENLADQTPAIEGMKLGRFDRVLGMTRERLRRVYHGGE